MLQQGNKGEAVIRVSTALSELSLYPTSIIDEYFAPALTTAVTSYQMAKGFFGKAQSGKIDKLTFDQLDRDFLTGFSVERGVLAKQKSATIPSETQSVDPAEQAASARAVSTEPSADPVTKQQPEFRPDIPGKGNYGTRLRAIVDQRIHDLWNGIGKGKSVAHATPGALYDAPTIDTLAAEAQASTNAVFGEYIKGKVVPALKMGTSVSDAWKHKEDKLKTGGKAEEDSAIGWRVKKILDGYEKVKDLDAEHGAIQTRNKEKAIIGPIKADLMKKYRNELLELHKAWLGYTEGGVIYVQLFKGATANDQRSSRWKLYQVIIHEYIHTLEHGDYAAYHGSLDSRKGGFTLREGTTDYFTKIVWSSINITDALRAKIEGPVHDPQVKFAIPPLRTYPEAKNAERLAGVVGIRNLAATFFLGKVDLIGKP
ncbi:hypothetical protein PTKU64_80460 [Paraburkholderia terrae]|uniref:Peptidoglycan binding-like domain-containing protein n=1 Tax=Paraburkholderia terrae TaxID=311230 RepID=A0ABN6JTQ1_9BURK|nr:peptidoglycan-binding protein [Paraburkholderia terrae]BCZ84371.1 hypothetical protein PTKU64_80460 [Paraburkholderia terrae]